jgi:hypothetical protein
MLDLQNPLPQNNPLFLSRQWNISAHVKAQLEKEKPRRELIHKVLGILRQEVKEYNRTAKSGEEVLLWLRVYLTLNTTPTLTFTDLK